jgi:hypothetical protein
LKNLQGPDILKLLIAVDELNIQPLISHVQEYLIEHQTEFLHQNPSGILETVYQHETFTDLWNFSLKAICEDPKILFYSDKFLNLKAPLLELLLKRDDLNMGEIEIWENLLKWCFAQQNMENDPSKWNEEDVTKIERSLYRFIPLIRFYDIKPTDFFYKVYCYKDVLPQDLIHDLLEFHIVPDMKPKNNVMPSRNPNSKFKIESTLIESKYVPIFTSWIDRKESSHYNKKDIPYEFKLLYRSSRDGFDNATFHRNCDNKGATIFVAKMRGSTQLIGGYNPLNWHSNGVWQSTSDSFLFNFTDGKNISTAKLGYVNNAEYAVCCSSGGPQMGALYKKNTNNWAYDYDNSNERYVNAYPNIGIPVDFTVEDYEVFQVIRK